MSDSEWKRRIHAEAEAQQRPPTRREYFAPHNSNLPVLRSLEILQEKLDRPAAQIPDNLALRSLELSSRALGYGTRLEQAAVQVSVENHLEILGDNLVKLLQRKRTEAS